MAVCPAITEENRGVITPKKNGRGYLLRPYSLTEYRRIYWKNTRTLVRNMVRQEDYDDLPDKTRGSILWDWW